MYSCLARAQVDNCNCTEMKFPSGKGICSTTSEGKIPYHRNENFSGNLYINFHKLLILHPESSRL